ncbi:MAG: ABC transporter permease [Dehalococcoidales bacterium]|nr:ABC transporter permease [Dehalococcoidales bacterium]
MNKTLTILKHEFLNTLRRKSFLLMTLAFPLLGILAIVGYQIISGLDNTVPVEETVVIGYVDQTNSFNNYANQEKIILVSQPDHETAFGAMTSGEISQYFIIPEDYLATGVIIRYTLDREMDIPGNVAMAIREFLVNNLLTGQVDSAIIERVAYPMSLSSITLDSDGQISTNQGGFGAFVLPYIFSLLLIMAIFTSSGFLLQGLGEEKENRVMEILLSSVSPRQLIAGKVLGLGAAGLVQIVIWLVSARYLANMASSSIGGVLSSLSIPTDFLIISLIYFILGYLLFAVIMAGAGSIGATARESQQLSVVFTLTAVVPFYFIMPIMENPNGTISQIFTFIPFTAPITVIMRMGIAEIPLWQFAISITIMIVTIIGLLFIVAKIFRTFLLMYGKTPKISEIFKYLRQA